MHGIVSRADPASLELEKLDALRLNARQVKEVLRIASALWLDSDTPVPEVAKSLQLCVRTLLLLIQSINFYFPSSFLKIDRGRRAVSRIQEHVQRNVRLHRKLLL